jgi:hypothetical protein
MIDRIFFIGLLFSCIINHNALSQTSDSMQMENGQSMKGSTMKMGDEMEEVAHPFFSHMGVPDAVGVYNLRLSGLLTNNENRKDGDFAFHFETGLTDFIGFHIRNDGFLDRDHTELMFQFAAIRSADKMSGFSPLIEFEFQTKAGGDRHTNILIGFTTSVACQMMAFNQALHYNARTEEYEFNGSLVVKVGSMIYPAVEIFSEAMPHEKPLCNILGGVKLRVTDKLLLGVALQAPITERKDFSWQLVVQPDIEWGSAMH